MEVTLAAKVPVLEVVGAALEVEVADAVVVGVALDVEAPMLEVVEPALEIELTVYVAV